MGTGQIGGGGTLGIISVSQLISPGVLTRLSLRTDKVFQPVGELFWKVHLAYTPSENNGVLATLIQGYIQWPTALTWEGFQEIKANQYMIITAAGIRNQVATVFDTRLTLTRDGALTELFFKFQAGKKPA